MTYDIRVILLEIATIEAIIALVYIAVWNWVNERRGRRLTRGLGKWQNRQKT